MNLIVAVALAFVAQVDVSVAPLAAAILMKFQEKPQWSLEELSAALKVRQGVQHTAFVQRPSVRLPSLVNARCHYDCNRIRRQQQQCEAEWLCGVTWASWWRKHRTFSRFTKRVALETGWIFSQVRPPEYHIKGVAL